MIQSRAWQVLVTSGLAMAALMVHPQANAAPSTCTAANTFVLTAASGFGGTFDLLGTTATPDNDGGAYSCIQQQDKIFSAFNLGTLPTGAVAVMNFATIGGIDTHSVTYSANYLLAQSPYTLSYNLAINPLANPLPSLLASSSDLVQSSGQATLDETLVSNLGVTYHIDFTKTGSSGYLGGNDVNLGAGTQWLDVTDVLTLSGNGSNISGLENSFVEAVPEPMSALLLSGGLLGLGFVRRRGRPA